MLMKRVITLSLARLSSEDSRGGAQRQLMNKLGHKRACTKKIYQNGHPSQVKNPVVNGVVHLACAISAWFLGRVKAHQGIVIYIPVYMIRSNRGISKENGNEMGLR